MNTTMEPRIQYAKTSDGVNIAHAVFGEGLPLIYTPSAYGIGVHLYSHMSFTRRGMDQLTAAGLQVVRYDGRGTGSSDRTVRDISLDTAVSDLEAIDVQPSQPPALTKRSFGDSLAKQLINRFKGGNPNDLRGIQSNARTRARA